MEGPSQEPSGAHPVLRSIRAHPVVTGVMLLCTLGGAIAGPMLMGDEWSLARQVLGGGLAGAGIGLLVTGTKMLAS